MDLSWQEWVTYGLISLILITLSLDLTRRRKKEKKEREIRSEQEKKKHLDSVKISAQIEHIEWMIRGGRYIHFTVNVFGVNIRNAEQMVYYITATDKFDRIIVQVDSRFNPSSELMLAYVCKILDVSTIGLGIKSFSYNLADRENKDG